MATETAIIVCDPRGILLPGGLVTLAQASQLRALGVHALPVHPEFFRYSGIGGYAKREWGSGYPLGALASKMHAPLTVFAPEECIGLHWVARIAPEGDRIPNSLFAGGGHFQIASDQQPYTTQVGLRQLRAPIEVGELGSTDDQGGWTVRGECGISLGQSGYLGLGLYSAAPGLVLEWLAVTVTTA